MKTHYILLLSVMLLFSCNKKNEIRIGQSIAKQITITFDSISIKNNDWHQFKLKKDTALRVSFSKGKVIDDVYFISAKEYSKNTQPIILKIRPERPGKHWFKLTYLKSSDDIKANFINGEFIDLPTLIVKTKWQYYKPFIIGLVVILILIILYFIAYNKRKNSFDNGYLQITYPEDLQVPLLNRRKIAFAKILQNSEVTAELSCDKKIEIIEDEEEVIKIPQLELFESDYAKINDQIISLNPLIINNEDQVSIFSFDNKKIISFQYIS